ncbi:MAG: metallophosphoesterase [Verrucomicrobia bacterium]|nr:metallophosphoesterase [Verrucomicrobiota bacterium]
MSSPTKIFRVSRRGFLVRTALIAGGMASGLRGSGAQTATPGGAPALRVLFATDAHLMVDDALRSEQGLAACLEAVRELRPEPDFILFGGDLTHETPELDFPSAERLLDRFLTLWRAHTDLPTFFAFGNHDLAGTKNRALDREDPRFGKGLFRSRLGLERLSYAFEKGGWRFIIVDDVTPEPDGSYIGAFGAQELSFLRSELEAHPQAPTVICTHIPPVSVLPSLSITGAVEVVGTRLETPASLVLANARELHRVLVETKADVKLVLAGHLHHLEEIQVDGVRYLTGGAICGNWWKGSQNGCPEGFTVLDLYPDGTARAEYRSYNWKAAG